MTATFSSFGVGTTFESLGVGRTFDSPAAPAFDTLQLAPPSTGSYLVADFIRNAAPADGEPTVDPQEKINTR